VTIAGPSTKTSPNGIEEKRRGADSFPARPQADGLRRFLDTAKVAAPMAVVMRVKQQLTLNTTMDITREQREGFMRLLQEAKSKRQTEFQRDIEKKVKEEVLPRIMQRQGIVKLVEQVKHIGSQLSESAQRLQGMDVFGQPATLWGKILGTNEGVEDLVEKMRRPYTEQADSALRDYDRAILQVLSATHLEDVQQIVTDLL
jgi:ATP-dependent Lon protease